MEPSKPQGAGRALAAFARQNARPLMLYAAAGLGFFLIVFSLDRMYDIPVSIVRTESGWGSHSYNHVTPLWVLVLACLGVWVLGLALLVRRLRRRGQGHGAASPPGVGYNRAEVQKAIRKRYQARFWFSFFIYTAALGVLAVLVLVVKNSRIWYGDEPFFYLLRLLNDFSPLMLAVLWLGGAAVLLFRQWRQCASDVVGLVDSIAQMHAEPDSTDIPVPPNLVEVKPVLQEIQFGNQRSRQQAKEAEQRKNDLIVYLAHDLKTPLTSVIGYLDLLSEAPDMPAPQKARYTGIALDKALRLENLLGQFFEISRYNLHEMVLEAEYFDLHYLLVQLADEFYPVLAAEGKTAAIAAPEALWMVGDSGKLARVFNNILRNAVAYSEKGSEIGIVASEDDGALTIAFTNRGRTIPPHKLEAIFDKFYRLDEARSGQNGGAGLGLAIAREIVDLHGGTIAATSENGYTTFTVMLPVAGTPPLAEMSPALGKP